MGKNLLSFGMCVLFMALVLGIGACGGGTVGTDSGEGLSVKLLGVLRSPSGEPVASASVIVLESGDITVTDANGEYVIDTHLSSAQFRLAVSIDSVELESEVISFADALSENLAVHVDLTLDIEGGQLLIISLSVENLSTSEAASDSSNGVDDKGAAVSSQSRMSEVRGEVVNLANAPLYHARVSIRDVDGSDRTDKSGKFAVLFPAGKEKITLKIEYRGVSAQTTIADLPSWRTRVTVKLLFIGIADQATDHPIPLPPQLEVVSIKVAKK